jgi:hypothetical protein
MIKNIINKNVCGSKKKIRSYKKKLEFCQYKIRKWKHRYKFIGNKISIKEVIMVKAVKMFKNKVNQHKFKSC